MTPPKKERGLCRTALEAAELPEEYHVASSVQAQWQREGERLLGLYRKTKSTKHWQAYCVHAAGMAQRLEKQPL